MGHLPRMCKTLRTANKEINQLAFLKDCFAQVNSESVIPCTG